MTKKFVHTDKQITGERTKDEFLIPDFIDGTQNFLGLETCKKYEFGKIVFTGVELNADKIISKFEKQRSLDIDEKERLRPLLENYLNQISNLKIRDKVKINNEFIISKIEKGN